MTKTRKTELTALEDAMTSTNRADLFRDLPNDDSYSLPIIAAWWDDLSLDRRRAVIDTTFEVTLLPRSNKDPGPIPERLRILRKALR